MVHTIFLQTYANFNKISKILFIAFLKKVIFKQKIHFAFELESSCIYFSRITFAFLNVEEGSISG